VALSSGSTKRLLMHYDVMTMTILELFSFVLLPLKEKQDDRSDQSEVRV
jgi:hypothetical protein